MNGTHPTLSIPLTEIVPCRWQPGTDFNHDELRKLALPIPGP